MPTVLRDGPYRFYFYSGDRDEPPHVHVGADDCEAKFWLATLVRRNAAGFARKELNRLTGNSPESSGGFAGELE